MADAGEPIERREADPPVVTSEELQGLGLDPSEARSLVARIEPLRGLPPAACWSRLSSEVLTPAHPFGVHRLIHGRVYAAWDPATGPPPAWIPPAEATRSTNIDRLISDLGLRSYAELHTWSVAHRDRYWAKLIADLGVRFAEPFRAVRGPGSGAEAPRWLVGGRLNIADSCLTADEAATAVLFQPEGEGVQRWSYGQLRDAAERVAGSLAGLGLLPGDAVAVCMPMTAESVAIYLGIVKAGCVAVAAADSLVAEEIGTRLRLGRAVMVFTQDFVGRGARRLPLYGRVVAAGAPRAVVLPCDRDLAVDLRAVDLSWGDFLQGAVQQPPISRDPDDPITILFSSGTTGAPKAIPWSHTTPIKCAADGRLHHDIQPGDVVAWPSSLGWMMGPWLVFAGLINRATIALGYSPPAGRAYGQFVQDAGVSLLGVVPSLVKIWRATGCMEGLDWGAIRAFSSTGECSNAEDMLYLMRLAGYRPVIEYCGGTEVGGAYLTGTLVQPCSPATFSTPALGLDVRILDERGQPATRGELFIVPPSIGLSTSLLGADHHRTYYEETPTDPDGGILRRHGDEVERLPGGYFRAHGRVDDTMNLHGIKVSSAEIERAVVGVAGILEAAAVAVPPPQGGPDGLVVFAVLGDGPALPTRALKAEVQRALRHRLSPLFKVQAVVPVASLPRTASNKVMRRVLRQQCLEATG